MYRTLLLCKIHRATVTGADLHYEGSITIDADLLKAAGLRVYERVQVVDVDNGARWKRTSFPAHRQRPNPAQWRSSPVGGGRR